MCIRDRRNSDPPASTATAQPSIIDVSRGGKRLWDIHLWTDSCAPPRGDSEAIGDDPDDNRHRQEGKHLLPGTSAATVSYTHLDVYKRQALINEILYFVFKLFR